MPRTKPAYPPEFKAEAVRLVTSSDRSLSRLAKDLGVADQTLRNWVKLASASKLHGTSARIVTPEQMDLSRSRAENVRLRWECEILKK